jgi:hypothetical protein
MYYKLFIFGQKELFGTVEINYRPMKEGDVFYFQDKKWKVLRIICTARAISFDDKGHTVFEDTATRQPLPELFITEIPEV